MHEYDVFGAIRSQSGSSNNYWLFTGEQRDGQPGVAGGVQRLPLDVIVSSTNLTGATVANLDDDPDSPDGNWATATTVADTSIQVGFPTPPGDPTPGADLQEFRVLLRKDAAGGNDPTYDIELWETGGGAPLATLISGATLSSDTGEVVSVTWDALLLGTADGSAVEVRVVGNRYGGSPSKRRTVEVGAVEWNADHQGAPGSELYFLRARYYDPETGRFIGQDPLRLGNPYVYVGNNPTNLIDPYGLLGCDDLGPFGGACEVVEDVVMKPVNDVKDTASYVDTMIDHPGSVIQQTTGLIIARFSFGDRFQREDAVFYQNCWGLCSIFRAIPNTRNITIGHFIFSRGEPGETTIQHELVHVRQGDKHGLRWADRYFRESVERGFRCNRYEEEARAITGQRSRCPKE